MDTPSPEKKLPMRRWDRLWWKEKFLLMEAISYLYAVKCALLFFSVNGLLKHTRKLSKNEGEMEELRLYRIRKALKRANGWVFWKNQCLVSSIAGKWMLNRRGIPSALWIGAGKDEKGNFIAHAWLKAGNFEMVAKEDDYLDLYQH
jgi:hypothetical protein